MSKWKVTRITYGKCVNKIDGVQKDYCAHFLAGGEEGTPEAFFCRGCGCHVCFHEKDVETSYDRSTSTVSYTECLKNHSPQTDGTWVDGCREFVAAGEEGTPEALSCAACGCHRSFHKKEYW
ncbi:unnamed protein product [Eruca vesicaria subsp. sativa]|uniref:ZF-HD dimerization-type domain-containing protein n=1 Tax=Eruca vesicaria subsp. sativa TaxID=29727 RepID=A0ABC8MA21_ERUVS|nr:unnamed protein product [Eruca vesicaria subsp. sativa]